MIRLLFLLVIATALVLFLRWLFRQPPKVYWRWTVILVALLLLLLVATGRAHWLAAVFAAILPFVRTILGMLGHLPFLKRVLGGVGAAQSTDAPGSEQTSTVQSRYIRMTLAHESGDIDGDVLEGQFKGRTLRQMELEALLQLLVECQPDEESVALLQAYLDRVYAGSWRQQAGDRADEPGQQQTSSRSGAMPHDEALQILGLSPDASDKDIIEAHRRLIQKVHPDRGGSAYLAAKINLAKDTLLAT